MNSAQLGSRQVLSDDLSTAVCSAPEAPRLADPGRKNLAWAYLGAGVETGQVEMTLGWGGGRRCRFDCSIHH